MGDEPRDDGPRLPPVRMTWAEFNDLGPPPDGTDSGVTHVLKIWPEPFEAVWSGRKTAEFRRDDRGFRAGDRACLREYDPILDSFSGREIEVEITDVRPGPSPFGIPGGYAMLSIRRVRGRDHGGLAWGIDAG